MTMLRNILFYVLVFIYLANTCVTGLVLKPKCKVQTFSCPCDQSSGFGATDLGKVSVTSCVADGNRSKDAVCSSEDVRTKCHEMQGLLHERAWFSRNSCFSFFLYPSQKLHESYGFSSTVLNCSLVQPVIARAVSWSLTILIFRETFLQENRCPNNVQLCNAMQ